MAAEQMTLIALGVNHSTAPVAVREKLAFPAERINPALRALVELPSVREAAILSTCNRTEFYCGLAATEPDALIGWIAEHHQICPAEFAPYLYRHTGCDSARHLFRVASGLDSLILGEPQILGQIKEAYEAATRAGTLGKRLGKMFQFGFAAAKKVRSDTLIGASPVSVAYAAVRLAQQIFSSLGHQTALLIGAGETIELTARYLHQFGVTRLLIANRTLSKARHLADMFGGLALELADIPHHLPEADIVIASTASPLPLLGKGAVERAIKARKHKPIFMVDLAVPRDIEPEVAQLRDVYLYSVDDLRHIVDENLNARREEAKKAEEIIDLEVEHFLDWLRLQRAEGTITSLRRHAEGIRDESLQRALRALQAGKSPEEALELLAHSLTNKLVHTPITRLRQAAIQESPELIDAAQDLFQLK